MAILSNDKTYVTVVKGDTLSQIAVTFKAESNGKSYKQLADLNNISNPNYIVVGQIIKLTGTKEPVKTNTTNKPKISLSGFQSNTERTLFVTWTWDKEHTKEYEVQWWYTTGDGVRFEGNLTTTTLKQSLWTPPDNAKTAIFKVRAIATTHKVNGKDEAWREPSGWSTETKFNMGDIPPKKPNKPTLTIEKNKAKVSLTGLNELKAKLIQFQLYRDGGVNCTKDSGKVEVTTTGTVSFEQEIATGHTYQVQCRSYRDGQYSDWSEWSDPVETVPATPKEITQCVTKTDKDVYLEWTSVANANSYEVQYVQGSASKFEKVVDPPSVKTENNRCTIDIDPGFVYFFRVRAVNKVGSSDWSPSKSTKAGKRPAAPTTWSSTTTAIVGEKVNLYWVHNAQDGSKQDAYYLEIYINGELKITEDITGLTGKEEDEGILGGLLGGGSSSDEEKTSSYVFDTAPYQEGVKMEWRVKTKGVKDEYSDWSMQREVDIYARPTLGISVLNFNNESFDTLTQFPFKVKGLAEPKTQAPIGYYITIVSNQNYETVDDIGNTLNVSIGTEVYSKYFDITDALSVEFSAHNVNLENNISYTLRCVVSMNSGLTAEASQEFVVAWADDVYEPNLALTIDEDTMSASIRPFCEDENGALIDGVTLSVYRREYDGSFVEIASNIANTGDTYVVDPHPALDYARYRVVAKTESTGSISYYDPSGYPVGCKEAILQWEEQWSSYNAINEDVMERVYWSGSLLRLKYNIDISDSSKADVALVKYIGRKHPVTYYGTQLGESSTWNMDVEKSDKETLYALRRLSKWAGDVYVREPSGTGYWANVAVSYNVKHCALTIPVTLTITRVEGGM